MFDLELLKNQVVMISGGGSGLGRAAATAIARHGGKVAVLGRRRGVLESVVDEIGAEQSMALVCDVRYSDEVERAVASALEKFGRIDALINNAAGNFVSPTERLNATAFKLIIDTVLMGTINCTLTLGKHWIAQGQTAAILNIVTNYAQTGSSYVVPSACAKAGVENMVRSLAAEWGRYGIRSVGISPGPFPTEGAMSQLRINEDLIPGVDISEFVRSRIPLGRMGRLEEFSDLVLFLLSPHAQYINGEIIRIDGGEVPNLAGEFNFMHALPSSAWDDDQFSLKRRPQPVAFVGAD